MLLCVGPHGPISPGKKGERMSSRTSRRRRWQGATYNVMFPLWLLVWFPSWLWVVLVPVNYAIDHLVLWLTLPADDEERGSFCRWNAWKLCIFGFMGDFVGSALLLGMEMALGEGAYEVADALSYDAFSNPVALALTVLAIAVAALVIYVLDRRSLHVAGLDLAQAKESARWIALITAPYLFLVPARILYGA